MSQDQRLNISEEFGDIELADEDASSFFVAREIKQSIVEYGVSQVSLKKLIELLALELENREDMLAIVEAVRGGSSTSSNAPGLIT